MNRKYEKLKEQIEVAVELIEEESQRHRCKTENVDFHGITHALGYTIVLSNLK